MELRIKADYTVIIVEERTEEVILQVNSKYLEKYINMEPCTSEEDIEYALKKWVGNSGITDFDLSITEKEEVDEASLTLLNVEELIPRFVHLIKPYNCCDNAPYKAKYCPECGKKLDKTS